MTAEPGGGKSAAPNTEKDTINDSKEYLRKLLAFAQAGNLKMI